MNLLPALTSTIFSSTIGLLRDSSAVQTISKRLNRRTMSSPEVSWPVPMRAIGAQNLLTMPGGVSIAGYLHKKGGSQFSLMKWPLRYIIIHKGCIYYFKSSTSPAPQGAFSLNGYNRVMRAAEETTSSNVFPFKIVHFSKKHRTWFFSAASEDERRKWMRYLRREINHYNDKKEVQIPSDTDSDADSFYGTIERPMDIKHSADTTEDDYGEDDDNEDEEDYLKPDDDCSLTPRVRPTAPPPSYPPPPVPAVFPVHQDSSAGFHKSPPPFFPSANRIPTLSLPKNPPPSVPLPPLHKDLSKGPLPPVPLPPPVHKPPSPTPPSFHPDQRRTSQCRTSSVGVAKNSRDWRPHSAVSVQSPATLPICDQLETMMALNGPVHGSLNSGGSQSLGSKLHNTSITPPQTVNTGRSSPSHNQLCSNNSSMVGRPPVSLQPKTGLLNKPGIPVPSKPPLPASRPKPASPLQRASPDGQSIRLQGDEIPTEYRRKRGRGTDSSREDSDDDYENVQLPESVFIDSTETSFVEKLFKESSISPLDGLYGIRNSGTKTSKVLVVWDVSINRARNYRLFEEGDCIFLESDVTFPNLPSLIEHYYSHPLPHHGSLCLQQPYTNTHAY